MQHLSRRSLLKAAGASALAAVSPGMGQWCRPAYAESFVSDSLPMQLYKSMNDEQKAQVCLPVDHPRRQFVSNWWYIHRDYRIPGTFSADQQELIQVIFDSLHNPEHREQINKQVEIDQYGEIKNAPAVGFLALQTTGTSNLFTRGTTLQDAAMLTLTKGRALVEHPFFTVTSERNLTKPLSTLETRIGIRGRSSMSSLMLWMGLSRNRGLRAASLAVKNQSWFFRNVTLAGRV